MRALPALAIAAMTLSIASSACSTDDHSYVKNVVDGETTPTMLTFDVNTFISDSGYTRYYITTPLWAMHEDAREPFWRFPEGIYLEQYDRDLNVSSTMRCDSARYLSQKRIWELDGNVVMVNTDRDSFLTQQVFWDQNNRSVYSDSFIHIVRSDRIIEGYGFTSNEPMTAYTVNKPTGIFPVNRQQVQNQAEAEPDTVSPADNRRRPRSQTQMRPTPTRNGFSLPSGDAELKPQTAPPGTGEPLPEIPAQQPPSKMK